MTRIEPWMIEEVERARREREERERPALRIEDEYWRVPEPEREPATSRVIVIDML